MFAVWKGAQERAIFGKNYLGKRGAGIQRWWRPETIKCEQGSRNCCKKKENVRKLALLTYLINYFLCQKRVGPEGSEFDA